MEIFPISILPPSILLVDDVPSNIEQLKEHLMARVSHCKVAEARTLQEATEKIKHSPAFDVIVTDMSLVGTEGGQGIEVAREGRTKDDFTEIIVVTLFANGDNITDAMAAGANQYLDRNLKNFVEIQNAVVEKRLVEANFRRNFTNGGADLITKSGHTNALYADLQSLIQTILDKMQELEDLSKKLSTSVYTYKTAELNITKIVEEITDLKAEVTKLIR